MDADTQFWLNWSVALIAAIATLSAVLVALFGQFIRAGLFPPQLRIELKNTHGSKARVRLAWVENSEPRERGEDSRYYHIVVSNSRRWSPAHQVQLYLLQVDRPGPDGEFRPSWVGEIPMNWRHQEVHPTVRTIGAAADCDFVSVVKGKWVELLPLIQPFNLDKQLRGPGVFVATLQARANEADSDPIRLQVSWDGQWHDGDVEMASHLVVKDITRAA